MTFHLYKIKFLTGVHLGSKSGVEPILHSDTLFSILYSESEELGRKLDKDKILLSSAFPYYEDSLYLPKPFIPLKYNDELDKKQLKNTSFVDLSLGIDDGCSFYKIEQRTNVTISRNTHDSVPYFNQILRFETDCGLWFICNENIEELLKSVGVGGIGGDKNNGLGKFEVEKIELSRDLKDLLETKTKYRMLISVVGPCEQDFSNDFSNSYYKLISRNSWKDNIKNDDINMFGEGSCFDFDLAGDIKDVRYIGCEHPIYKYGKSLSIALKIKGNLNGEGLYEIL